MSAPDESRLPGGGPDVSGKTRGRAGFAFCGLLALLIVIFFWRVAVAGDVFFFRDFGLFFYPKRLLVASAVREFRIPLWESLSGGGVPVLGTYQSAVFYPPALVYYLLPMPHSFMIFTLVHFLVTGLGAFFMLRAWGARRMPAAVGGILWTFAPSLVSIVDNVSFLTGLAWLPWCLGCSKRFLAGGRASSLWGLLASFTMALLAGAPEPVLFIAVALVLLLAYQVVAGALRGFFGQTARRALGILAVLLVAALLAGVQTVPFLCHLAYSERAEKLSLQESGSWSMAPGDVLLCVLPRLGLYPERGGIYWAGQRWLKSFYLGAAVPLLVAWAVFLGRRRRNIVFAVLGLFFLLLALGSASPVWRFLYRVMPGFGLVRYPAKFFLPAAFSAAVLAAFAVDDLAVIQRKRKTVVLALFWCVAAAGVGCIAAGMAFSLWPDFARTYVLKPNVAFAGSSQTALQEAQQFHAGVWSLVRSGVALVGFGLALSLSALAPPRLRPRILVASTGLILVLDVFTYGMHLNPVTDKFVYEEPPEHLAQVETGPGAGRVLLTDELSVFLTRVRLARFGGTRGLVSFLMSVKGDRFAYPESILKWASSAAGRRFSSLDALDKYLGENEALRLSETAQYDFYREAFYTNTNLLCGVPAANPGEVLKVKWSADLWKRLSAGGDAGLGQIEKLYAVSTVAEYAPDDSMFVLKRVEDAVPRAFLIANVLSAGNDEEALDAVCSPDFDPRACLVLSAEDAAWAAAAAAAESAGAQAPVKWIADTGNSQVLEANAGSPAFLYVADNYYPSLRATVDGVVTPILRANYAFRAVPIREGRHVVEFTYAPSELHLGLAATCAGLAILTGSLALRAYRNRIRNGGAVARSQAL